MIPSPSTQENASGFYTINLLNTICQNNELCGTIEVNSQMIGGLTTNKSCTGSSKQILTLQQTPTIRILKPENISDFEHSQTNQNPKSS